MSVMKQAVGQVVDHEQGRISVIWTIQPLA
jgi:hypothetical protein